MAGALALPFVEFRPNRIVSGQLSSLVSVGAGWGWLLVALAAAALAVAVAGRAPWRGDALLAAGVSGFIVWTFALGAAAAHLMPPGDSSARVSLASGAWVALVGIAVLWFQGARSSRVRGASAIAAAVAVAAVLAAWFLGGLPKLSLVYEYQAQADSFWPLVAGHVGLSVGGTAIAVVLGVPLGVLATRVAAVRLGVIPAAGVVQTIPSLALYGLLIVPLGMLGLPTIGAPPALIALTLYALLPIVRNTYLGVSGVDSAVIDAGRGMGMSGAQLLWRVELPLALPLIVEGIRASLVMTIGVAAVMAIAGASTLGTLVFLGWGSTAVDQVLLGALPMVVLSIVADQGMRALERLAVSPGIRVSLGQE